MPGVLRHYAAWVLAGIGAAGCTSILGDFSASPAGADGSDSGIDGQSGGDGAVPPPDADGASDAPGPAPMLACDAWRFPKPLLVQSLQGQTQLRYSENLYVASVGQDVVRIVASLQNASATTVYTVEKNDSSPRVTPYPLPTGLQPRKVRRVAGATRLLATVLTGSPQGPTARELFIYTFPDTMPPRGPADPPIQLTKGSIYSDDLSADAIETMLGGAGFFFAVSQGTGPSTYELAVGQYLAKTTTYAYNAIAKLDSRSEPGSLLHVGSDVYVFTGSDPQKGGTSSYKVHDDGTVPAGTTARKLWKDKPAILFDTEPRPGSSFNFAFLEVDTQSTTEIATLRIGQLDASQLDTFIVSDIPRSRGFTDIGDLPVDKGQGEWDGDDFYAAGLRAIAGKPGLNFLWVDAAGTVRGERLGDNGLLVDHPSITGVSVSIAQHIAVKYVTFNVAWIETSKDAAAGVDFDTLYMNELICH